MMQQAVIHTINLYGIGGVQKMFVPFYRYAKAHSVFQHEIFGYYFDDECSTGLGPCRNIRTSLAAQLHYLYHLCMPHSIMHFYNMMAGPMIDRVLAWLPASQCIFHEHGGIWNIGDAGIERARRNAERAVLVLANSEATKIMLHKKVGIAQDKIRVVHNGLITKSVIPSRQKKQIPFVVGFLGRFEIFKGVHVLIECARLLAHEKNIQFRLAGSGPYEKALRKRAQGLENITFVGPSDDAFSFITECDVMVVPSLREPFGNVIIEAGMCKKGVIATNVDGIPEIITNGRTGILLEPTCAVKNRGVKLMPHVVVDPHTEKLVEPKEISPDALAEAIKALYSRPERLHELGMNLHDYVTAEFSLQQYFDALEAVYASVFSS